MNQYNQPVTSKAYNCVQCGYDLSGSALGGVCPECGTSVANTIRVSGGTSAGSTSTATTCMVMGILGLAVCGICGPIAIWMYYQAVDDVKRNKAPTSSLGMAKAGLIMGWIATALMILAVLVVGLAIVAGM